jgi:CRP-like cAMP-binding protein
MMPETQTDATNRLILAAKLFEQASPSFLTRLQQEIQLIKAPKGKILFIAGEAAQRFFIIKSGWVKLFRETLDGAQAVVDILTERNIFGETSIFQDGTYPYSAEVVEPSEILSLPLGLLKQEIESNPKMAMAMLAAMARYRRHQDLELEHRTLQNAPQRIGCFLLRLADQGAQGPITIHLPYDKTLLASRLGMQPETFSRALSKLREATGMQVRGATIELNSIETLSDFCCSACSSEFPCEDLVTQG